MKRKEEERKGKQRKLRNKFVKKNKNGKQDYKIENIVIIKMVQGKMNNKWQNKLKEKEVKTDKI